MIGYDDSSSFHHHSHALAVVVGSSILVRESVLSNSSLQKTGSEIYSGILVRHLLSCGLINNAVYMLIIMLFKYA